MFKLVSGHQPAGDQPEAIKNLLQGLEKGYRDQTLLGVTGSGKTFTMANVIEKINKPTLVIAHNKTLAAQLCNEFRELFPENSVNYFVSYYDYYQPEAYMPTSDTYIDKEAMVNEEIDKLRHAATVALLTRSDVIVVASVSCIYGLGAPEEYRANIFHLKIGDDFHRASFVKKLVELQYTRTNADLTRGTFRLRGDTWEIMPADREMIYLIEAPLGKIKSIYEILPAEGFKPGRTPVLGEVFLAPAKHFVTSAPNRERAIALIEAELKERLRYFDKNKKLLEAERLERRTKFDLAMMKEVGYCHGIENYSRHLSGRKAGDPPETLLDYFPKTTDGGLDFLTIIDESHVAVSQIGGMFEGDASRKRTLIEYGFRLPSASDNRPLTFEEFRKRTGKTIYTSATPGNFERENSSQIVEQIIRPTGLVDPVLTIKPALGQIDDLIPRILDRVKKKERTLVTTLTKKMAEDLSQYLEQSGKVFDGVLNSEVAQNRGERSRTRETLRLAQGEDRQPIKVTYLHSDVKTLERIKILTKLRRGEIDVLVGVNLLREGLDLPEVSLVAILDADKEGFLRSETSLIQTIGRAARNVAGEVLIYADKITGSVERAIRETERRRKIQLEYNKKHGITPQTIIKAIKDILPESPKSSRRTKNILNLELKVLPKTRDELQKLIKAKEKEMKRVASELDFELAAILRDEIKELLKISKEKK